MANKLILALLPLTAFGLPTRDGQEVEIEEKKATELVELGYAKFVDKKAEAKQAKIDAATNALEEAKAKLDGLVDGSEEEKLAAKKEVDAAQAVLDGLNK